VTVIAQIFFPKQANGSIITVNGVKYGSELLGQQYDNDKYMWGRIMNINTTTFTDKSGKPVLYAQASQLSPKSDKFKELVKERVDMIENANPNADTAKVPQDLVTSSGSGLDPQISLAAANYQISRVAQNNELTKEQVKQMIEKCTTHKVFGIFGQETVNVLKVNLMLDKILS